jgi:hypothetical protein
MSKRAILSIAVIAGLLATAGTASAGLIVADGFETSDDPTSSQYDADVKLVGQGPGIAGFSDTWQGSYDRFNTVETGISGFFKIEEVGGLEVIQEGSNSTRDRTRTITGDTPAASKTYWLAFSANFAETTGGGVSMGYELTSGDTLDFGMEAGAFKIEDDGGTAVTFGTAEADTDYLLITSVEITHFGSSSTTGGLEKLNAWVFSATDFAEWDKQESTLSSDATATLGEVTDNLFYSGSTTDEQQLYEARVHYIEPGGGNTQLGTKLDEYRISTDFDGLDIVPEPATMSMLAIGGLGALLRRKRR